MSNSEARPGSADAGGGKNTERKRLVDKEKPKKMKSKFKFFSSEDKLSRMEKYEELDRNHPLNRAFQGDASFRGPVCKICHSFDPSSQKKMHRPYICHHLYHFHFWFLYFWSCWYQKSLSPHF
jgi:hypothetical protein